MKKFILLCVVFLTVTFSATAQKKYGKGVVNFSTKYVESVSAKVQLTADEKAKLMDLKCENRTAFLEANKLEDKKEAAAKKRESNASFNAKLESTFGKDKAMEIKNYAK